MGIPRTIIATSATLAALACVSAQAADYDAWSGFYLGAAAGNREQQIDWEQGDIYLPSTDTLNVGDLSGASDSSKSNNGYFSLYGGYNWLISERVLLGLELSAGYADGQTDKHHLDLSPIYGFGDDQTSVTLQSDWDASLRGRAGYLITPSVLFYGAAGIAATRLESSTYCPSDNYACSPFSSARHESHDEIVLGWTAGLGLEASLSEHLLARAEYQYSDYQSTSFWAMSPEAFEAFGVKNEVDSGSQKLTLGLAYKF
ncbi:outer membrane protein [Pseudomonas sp.]|uniref:outer membrane protein n=1 Tax=Pseudomonas sp. TaxID=306 RepID=UPI003C76C9D1